MQQNSTADTCRQQSALDKAISHFGTKAALARALRVGRSTGSHWGIRGVPPTQARCIELATGGAVMREELRPDVFGAGGDV